MSYSILKLIELMGDEFPLLLNSILTRIPIVVIGQDVELIDDVSDSLTSLCPHRHRIVFWRDFTSEDEIDAVWEEEKHDYEVSRTIVCSLASNLRLALDRIRTFGGWVLSLPVGSKVLGTTINEHEVRNIVERIRSRSENCGILRVHSPSALSFGTLEPTTSSLALEKGIVDKILTRKRQSLERIKRLLRKSLRDVDGSAELISTILTLDDESDKITQDVFDEEINSYVHAARRAVTILSRIRLAREFGAPTTLTERNLFEAVGWDSGNLGDLIQLIIAEWHEDFSDCVKTGTLSGLGAWVDSMWGT
ncbi:hypothetical protein EU519_00430 [Candidatus Thorarchaeota archaeon]|nr:MAG: hypothetical protein EU519_00430 [Candidatus Thorarchaeota archaeon]